MRPRWTRSWPPRSDGRRARPASRTYSSRSYGARPLPDMAVGGTRVLLEKELRQHGWVLAGLTVLLALAFFTLKVSVEKVARMLSSLEAMTGFAKGPLAAAAVYLGHRLVVQENYGRTQ